MTRLQLQALIKLTISVLVLAALSAIFFSGGGAASFADDKTRKLLLAAVLGAGYLGVVLTLFLTRARRLAAGRVEMDERDERIIRLANGVAVVVLGVSVFIGCIALYEWYHEAGLVPVGWMWFLAYASSFIAIASHAAATLVLYGRMDPHGQG